MKIALNDVCEKITDGSHNPPSGIEHSNYLMLSSKNIFDDSITLEEPRYLSEDDFVSENTRTNVAVNDLLMTIVGTVGRVAVVPSDFPPICLQRSVAVIKTDKSRVNSRYMMYQLQSMKRYFEVEAHGVAQKGIYLKQLASVPVLCPDLDNQRKIVSTLDTLQSIITHRRTQLEKLDLLVKARFVEMFGDMILNPNKWEKVLLGEVCDVRDGTHDSPKYFVEGYPLVTSKNVTGGKIDFTNCNLICEDDYNKINQRSKVDRGDILMPMIGTVGNPVIIDINEKFAIKNVALIKFRNDSKVINIFIKSLLESDYFDRVVINKVRGGTQKFISLGDIRKLNICLPPFALQTQFADFVKQVDKSKATVQKALDEAQLLFDSLMQEYFG